MPKVMENAGEMVSSHSDGMEPGPSRVEIAEPTSHSVMDFCGVEMQQRGEKAVVDSSEDTPMIQGKDGVIDLSKVRPNESEENGPLDLRVVKRDQQTTNFIPSSCGPSATNLQTNQRSATNRELPANSELLSEGTTLGPLFHQRAIRTWEIIRQVYFGYGREAERYLEPNQWMGFSRGLWFGSEFQLSEWSDTQLKDLTAVLQQSPEALIEKGSITGITVNDIDGIPFESIGRALDAVKAEKLKRVGKIFEGAAREVLCAVRQPDFPQRQREFQELVEFMERFNVDDADANQEIRNGSFSGES